MKIQFIGNFPEEGYTYFTTSLLVISNHHPSEWSDEQKKGWKIYYLPFPEVPPDVDERDIQMMAFDLAKVIKDFIDEHNDAMISLQGEFSLVFSVYNLLPELAYRLIFPTTQRISKEITKDGKTIKVSEIKFIRWRLIARPEMFDNNEIEEKAEEFEYFEGKVKQ